MDPNYYLALKIFLPEKVEKITFSNSSIFHGYKTREKNYME
jgi:hypothetical protein